MRLTLAPILTLVLVTGTALLACSDDDTSSTPSGAPTPTAPVDAGGSTATGDGSTPTTIVDVAVAAGNFKTLVSAVQAAGLESTLRGAGPFTVFAPTDDAFAKLPPFLLTKLTTAPYKTELGLVLEYHVLAGTVKAADVLGKTQDVATLEGGKLAVDGSMNKVTINGAVSVVQADVAASNGVIHAVDGVLLPTIVDTASGYDDGTNKFTTLVSAIQQADLGATLSGPGPFTVFAPTDAAFAQVPKATLDAILADKQKLTRLLTYHVVGAAVYQKDVQTGSVETLDGRSLAAEVTASGVTLADSTSTKANVLLTDLPNRNGVIHAIDKVLIPSDL